MCGGITEMFQHGNMGSISPRCPIHSDSEAHASDGIIAVPIPGFGPQSRN
jgi:hypothetical protein